MFGFGYQEQNPYGRSTLYITNRMEPTHQSQLTGSRHPPGQAVLRVAGLTYALFVVAALAAGLILRLGC